jgi:NDP-sugar pyrophosphorylase family protein
VGEDFVVKGDGCTIKDSELKSVVLFEDCEIEDCVLSNCVLDKHCRLKGVELHGKMLREGTVLEQE